mgnify:CR=1 FL=1
MGELMKQQNSNIALAGANDVQGQDFCQTEARAWVSCPGGASQPTSLSGLPCQIPFETSDGVVSHKDCGCVRIHLSDGVVSLPEPCLQCRSFESSDGVISQSL